MIKPPKFFLSLGFLAIFFLAGVSLAKSHANRPDQEANENSFDEENPDEPYSDDADVMPFAKSPSRPSSNSQVGVSGGIGVGAGYYSLLLTVTYKLSRWFGIDFNGFYQNDTGDNYQTIEYGPEVDLVFRIPNPTIVTPFVGAGPGFIFWKRSQHDVPFDESSSLTANALVGAHLALTKNFGFQVIQKWTTYMNTPPKTWDDHSKSEPDNFSRTQVGFIISF